MNVIWIMKCGPPIQMPIYHMYLQQQQHLPSSSEFSVLYLLQLRTLALVVQPFFLYALHPFPCARPLSLCAPLPVLYALSPFPSSIVPIMTHDIDFRIRYVVR